MNRYLFILLIFGLFFSSCSKKDGLGTTEEASFDGGVSARFAFTVPDKIANSSQSTNNADVKPLVGSINGTTGVQVTWYNSKDGNLSGNLGDWSGTVTNIPDNKGYIIANNIKAGFNTFKATITHALNRSTGINNSNWFNKPEGFSEGDLYKRYVGISRGLVEANTAIDNMGINFDFLPTSNDDSRLWGGLDKAFKVPFDYSTVELTSAGRYRLKKDIILEMCPQNSIFEFKLKNESTLYDLAVLVSCGNNQFLYIIGRGYTTTRNIILNHESLVVGSLVSCKLLVLTRKSNFGGISYGPLDYRRYSDFNIVNNNGKGQELMSLNNGGGLIPIAANQRYFVLDDSQTSPINKSKLKTIVLKDSDISKDMNFNVTLITTISLQEMDWTPKGFFWPTSY